MERPTWIIHTALQETTTQQDGDITYQDINNLQPAMYSTVKYGRLPKTSKRNAKIYAAQFTQNTVCVLCEETTENLS